MVFTGKRFAGLVLFIAFGWLLGPLEAQEAPTPEGHWEGAIVTPGGDLVINIDLMLVEGSWSGDISIPAQATEDFPLSEVTVKGVEVSFLMAGVPGDPTFKGSLSEDGQTLSGRFSQGRAELEFNLTRGG